MKIGIISDTHSYLDPQVFHYFAQCHEIWHAGDIGNIQVAEQLASITTLRGVHGNIDNHTIRKHYPEHQHFTHQGLNIWLTHIAGKPNAYPHHITNTLIEKKPHILVCGHTHILRVIRDTKHQNLLYLNPGAAGKYGIHAIRTLLRFDIQNGQPCNMEVIELGRNTYHR